MRQQYELYSGFFRLVGRQPERFTRRGWQVPEKRAYRRCARLVLRALQGLFLAAFSARTTSARLLLPRHISSI
jgi:hypothetical protein